MSARSSISLAIGMFAGAIGAQASAGTVSYVGDVLGNPNWRSSSVAKSINPGGDNIFGNAGYAVLDSSAGDLLSAPAGVTVSRLASQQYPGNSSYLQIANPVGSGTITSGVWYDTVSAGGQVDNYASLTSATAESYVVGVFTDNTDYANISPSDLRIHQVSGSGNGDSGYITNIPTRTGAWYFFDVSGNAGDVFDISGIATTPAGPNSDGIGIISFDAANIPEPSTLGLLAAGLIACLLPNRRWRQAR